MSITAILCVRNEGAFLLDWLAHHQSCGIDHVVALSNDCADGTDTLLDRLAELGHVTHIRNDGPYDRGGIQFTGLKRADRCEAVRARVFCGGLQLRRTYASEFVADRSNNFGARGHEA